MKKKVSVLLLSVVMVLSMVGCSNTRSKSIETTSTDGSSNNCKLEFDELEKGTYNLKGAEEDFFIYRFDSPNSDIVVYQISDSLYILGEDSGETGTSYAAIIMENSQFIALSDKYLLFITGEDKVAVALEKKENVAIGESSLQKYSFNDLSDKEKNAFIYSIACKKVTPPSV